jgi:hypothetical protein
MRAFISYSVADKQFGGAVKQALKNLGVECFLAHEDIRLSEEWKECIIQELQKADIFVAVLSSKFKASYWCEQELGFIVSRPEAEVVIVPLSIDDTIPYGFISHLQGQRVSDESSIPRIIKDLLYRRWPREMKSLNRPSPESQSSSKKRSRIMGRRVRSVYGSDKRGSIYGPWERPS